jgi:hypothetical protein
LERASKSGNSDFRRCNIGLRVCLRRSGDRRDAVIGVLSLPFVECDVLNELDSLVLELPPAKSPAPLLLVPTVEESEGNPATDEDIEGPFSFFIREVRQAETLSEPNTIVKLFVYVSPCLASLLPRPRSVVSSESAANNVLSSLIPQVVEAEFKSTED